MKDTFQFTVHQEGYSVRDFLGKYYKFSFRLLQKLEKEGLVSVNNQQAILHQKINLHDSIKIDFLDEYEDIPRNQSTLSILYEDIDLLVIDKEPYQVVHPTKTHIDDTVANRVAHYFDQIKLKRKVRFINRLDMNTSGVLMIAKNPYVHHIVSEEMRSNRVEKIYLAVTDQKPSELSGTIDAKIGRVGEDIRHTVNDKGKPSVTHYQVIDYQSPFSLLKIVLETGRTHQIRVHLSSEGMPILGDELYGEPSKLIQRQALHCHRIRVRHPRTSQWLVLESPLPQDIRSIMSMR